MFGGPCLTLGNSGVPIMLQLHRFMVAVSRVSVNHDGRGFPALMVGAFPVLTLLPGFIVSVCCVSSLPSYVLCIGRLEPRIWGIFVCYLEVSILFEQWAGQRLLGEKVTRSHVRARRPISISSVPMSFGMSSVVRVLRELPGGVGRFLPCRVRKSYVWASALGGWEQCSHCLTSRPSGWPASPGPLKFRPLFFPCVPGIRISLFP